MKDSHNSKNFLLFVYKNKNETENTDEKRPSFPLSDVLRERNFSLGRNARMIAAQPMDRLITNKQVYIQIYSSEFNILCFIK